MKTNGKIQLYPFVSVAAFLICGIVTGTMLYGKVPFMAWFTAAIMSTVTILVAHGHCVIQSLAKLIMIAMTGAALAVAQRSTIGVKLTANAVSYQAVVTSRPVVKKKSVSCDLTVIGLKNKPLLVKAYFSLDGRAKNLCIGNGVSIKSILRKPTNFEGSSFDYRRYLLFHGYSATTFIFRDHWQGNAVSLKSLSLVDRIRLKALVLRDRLLTRYSSYALSDHDYAVLSAITLGDKTAISRTLADDYSVSGASHVLALSGLHLGIIFAILTFFFSRLRLRALSLTLVICAIWTYVFIVGMSPSIMRSAVMLSVYSFVSLFNRNNLSLNTLALTAVALLVSNPLNLYDVSFQMSFISVLFIVLFFRPIYRLLPVRLRHIKAINAIWQMTAVSLTAQAGVAPLVALYFNRFSCYFLLTNYLVIPLATIILYAAVFLVLTAAIPILQSMVMKVLFTSVSWLNTGVHFIASWPGASIDGIRINITQVFCYYVAIAGMCGIIHYVRRMMWFCRRPIHDSDFQANCY